MNRAIPVLVLVVGGSSISPPSTAPRRFAGQFISRATLPLGDKVVALTFDDGPRAGATEKILATLNENDVKATFFLIGKYAKQHPDLVKAIAEGGHAIGNHSYTHARALSREQARREVIDTNTVIRELTGKEPVVFRPPFGNRASALATAAKAHGFPLILWSISSADTRPIDARMIEDNVLHTPWPGDIVLFHDGGGKNGATVAALPGILRGLKRLGFRCVTIPELLTLSDTQLAQRRDQARGAGGPR